ncbi:MAG: S9 family peptidase [Sphingomonadaceae bacterium]
MNNVSKFALGVSALLLAIPAASISAQDTPTRAFTGNDLFKLEGAADPQISPDGSQIVYVRMSGDIMRDRYSPSLWLVDAKSGVQRPLVTDGSAAFSPRWSPDSTRIAYVSTAGDNGAQLHILWLKSGVSVRVTDLPDSPGSIAWSPDGKQIAYTMRVPGDAPKLGKAPDKPEGAKWAKPLKIIDKVTYRFDDAGYLKPGFDQVFVVGAEGGASRRVTSGNWDAGGSLSWMPDGRAILFTGNRVDDWERAGRESEIYRVDLASGAITTLTRRVGPDYAPKVSPDGKRIAYLGFDDSPRAYEDTQLYVMKADGSDPRSLTTSLDRSVNAFDWSGGDTIYASYADAGIIKVARIGMDGRRSVAVQDLVPGSISDRPYAAGDFSVSRDGTLAYGAGSFERPADLFVKSGGKARQLTHLNATWMQGKDIAPMRKLAVTAPDGKPIDAWLIEPPHRKPGERVPLILEIHGGPNAEYGPGFSTDDQLYAAAGYAVLYTNPRGSTSYGAGFANLIDKDYPGPDYDDLMAAVDAAIADGVADPNNLFVTGGSGGGVLTSWIVGKTDRFAAAATQKPVINWTSEALTADLVTFAPRYWFGAMPWEQPMEYWKRSPLSLVGNVKTPTMVVVGEDDYRTPASESEQYYAALQLRGVPTTLVIVPDASHHGIAGRPSQSAAKAAAIIAWFDKYKNGEKVDQAAAKADD